MNVRSLMILGALASACGSEAANEDPSAEAPSAEAPSAEAPSAEAPRVEAPGASAVDTTNSANAAAASDAPSLTATVGQPAPSFELRDQAGQTHRLEDLRGKIVVLEWLNPQCPYVQRHYQARTMTGLVSAFPNDRVVWLAVDSSHFVQPEDSEAWRQEHGIPYPILQDPSGATGRTYDATTTPNMYVIDATGVLRYRGAIDDDPRGRNETPRNFVREAVQALLDGGEVPTAQTQPYGCSVKYEDA